ncbi:hypothetical protein N8I77_009172 [Diaporthe amygdali]|uniref:Uncharacterized protein n=1 Tax=Phomopsis amygdali TaxID=1214568 RepID=A0AAD9W0G0_PHOAM|nr:hypothetical protein N8I77_009172 [Diaporthe amygdali]
MADRGWFGRGRPAHIAQQPPHQSNTTPDMQSEAGDQASHASLHRSLTQIPLQQSHKPPTLAKISSYIGLGTLAKAQSPTVAVYPELVMERSDSMKSGATGSHVTSVDGGGPIGDWRPANKKEGKFPYYNEADCTWHNPSLEQMVETVSCTIMKNGSSAPIPRHLNGWIAGIIEEVSHQTSELNSLRTQVAQLKATRQEEVMEFSKVTEEWALREMNFKAEINRLEHIISDTQQGAESVLLARAGSVVNRNDGRAFRAKLDQLSRSDEGDENALPEEGHPADRHRDYLVEQDKRDSIALSPGDVGLTVNTTPYQVLGSTPSLLDRNNDVHLSKQLRNATSKRCRKKDQDIGAKLVAARITLQTTGKPPAPSAQNSNDSSSQSSSGNASCSSSLITQGLAEKIARAKVTPHTSPTKDENLCGRPAEEPKKRGDILGTIRQLAVQNGGLPDDAIDDGSSCSSSIVDPRQHRAFSFSDGDDQIASEDEPTPSMDRTSRNNGSSSQNPPQVSAVQDQLLASQFDGASHLPESVSSSGLGYRKSASSSSSSDMSQRRSHASMQRSMGQNHATEASKKQEAANEVRKLAEASICSPMIIAMARERSIPSPTKKVQEVQEGQVPRESRRGRLLNRNYSQGRAFISDEELAVVANRTRTREPAQVRARGHSSASTVPSAVERLSTDVGCNQEAAFSAARALKNSTSEHKSQNESQAQAA